MDKSAIDAALNRFNMKLLKMELIDEEWYSNRDVHGIKYNERSIPDYLKVFLQHRGENLDWFSPLAVIRQFDENVKNPMVNLW